jgi:hypothetical protein
MKIKGIEKMSVEDLQKKAAYLTATGRAGDHIMKYIKFHLRRLTGMKYIKIY